jgi:hypothetical protein
MPTAFVPFLWKVTRICAFQVPSLVSSHPDKELEDEVLSFVGEAFFRSTSVHAG